MKTFNIRFRSDAKLRDFIYENQITDSQDILIQVFTHLYDTDKIKRITSLLCEILPSAKIIGTTTDGEAIEGRILTSNTVISITLFDHSYLKTQLLDDVDDSFEAGSKLAQSVVDTKTKAMIIFASAQNIDAQKVLEGIKSVRSDIVISGGLSGDGGRFNGGLVFDQETIVPNGIVVATLNGEQLTALNRYTSEWEPVGREFKITKSKDNRIFTVDKMSVYRLYKKYLGDAIAQKLPLSGLQFPFVLKDKESGRFIARSVRSNPKDGSLIFAAKMDQGESVQIAFGNAEKMLSNTQNIIKYIAKEVPRETLFIYASAGRRRFLQNIAYAEIEPYKMLGTNAGFFGYGEFFSNADNTLFLNQSMTCLVLSENPTLQEVEVRFKSDYKNLESNLEITKALTNIAKVSSQELQELNQKLEQRVKEEVQKNRNKDSILIHNSKLAQMGEMMSMIAHQWRQPLSAISATSTGLQVKIELDKYNPDFFLTSLTKIEEYVKHLSDTINDFTNFFKPSKKKEEVIVANLLNKAHFILSPSFSKYNIEVDIVCDPDLKLKTYANEVIQVLINILKNAENALVKREIETPMILLLAKEKDAEIIIEISDNAGGIDSAIIERIFDAYYTTHDANNATGLGLYMSKFIIENSCKGRLFVENVKDGAKFTVVLG
ncbi:MAG: FIST C-terminal domain-containing protein [Epsilonproteobacteria bacterium]|nr:FIST C-terminal domain-containing protein [Campylobacterota bacterium]